MSTFPDSLVVSVSGIRGRVGIDLTADVVARFASAFGSFVQSRGWGDRIALARDSRPSGPAFSDAAAAGLRAVGCSVSDLGLVPTPTALLEIERAGLAGGIVITASHNPKEWNALKLASPRGAFLTPEEGAEFVAALREGRPPSFADWGGLGDRVEVAGAVDRHISSILDLDLIDAKAIAKREIKVAVDGTRGAGGVILPELLERLGCSLVPIELEPDGLFTREPEPIPENLGELRDAVVSQGADLGMAVDPDADRLALIDADGRAIGEDYTLALAARLVLEHGLGTVVANLSTSQVVEDVCGRVGAEYRQAPVGEANVASLMREAKAVVGGEGNGGVILPALHFTRDAPLAVALILQLIAESGLSLQDLVAEHPRYVILKDKVPRMELELDRLSSEIQAEFPGAELDWSDGLHLRWRAQKSWLHVRPSGTEPVVRLIAEGPVADEARIGELIEASKKLMGVPG